MGRILRRPRAREDLIEIWTYVADGNEAAADGLLARIDAVLGLLADRPLIGRERPELPTASAASRPATTWSSIALSVAGSKWFASAAVISISGAPTSRGDDARRCSGRTGYPHCSRRAAPARQSIVPIAPALDWAWGPAIVARMQDTQRTSAMRPIMRPILRAVALGLTLAATLQPALARSAREDIEPAEERIFPFDAQIPGCQDPGVLEQVSTNFAEKEAKFWNSSMTILSFDTIARTAWRPWGLDTYPRRFCSATATTSDGVRRKVDYSVRESTGFIGASWGVEFCVHGLDRDLAYAYATACRMARP